MAAVGSSRRADSQRLPGEVWSGKRTTPNPNPLTERTNPPEMPNVTVLGSPGCNVCMCTCVAKQAQWFPVKAQLICSPEPPPLCR